MGFTPQQVGKMTLWQFNCCVEGYLKANSPEEKPEAPSDQEFDAMLKRHGYG